VSSGLGRKHIQEDEQPDRQWFGGDLIIEPVKLRHHRIAFAAAAGGRRVLASGNPLFASGHGSADNEAVDHGHGDDGEDKRDCPYPAHGAKLDGLARLIRRYTHTRLHRGFRVLGDLVRKGMIVH